MLMYFKAHITKQKTLMIDVYHGEAMQIFTYSKM